MACRLPRDAYDHGARIAEKHGIARSSRWPEVERAHLAIQPVCVACLRGGLRVEVHHILPFHICIALGRPDLELDPRNLITLCAESDAPGAGNHHLLLGHLDDWESMNLRVRGEASAEVHGWTAEAIRASMEWQKLVARRVYFDAMDASAKRALRLWVEDRLPRGSLRKSHQR